MLLKLSLCSLLLFSSFSYAKYNETEVVISIGKALTDTLNSKDVIFSSSPTITENDNFKADGGFSLSLEYLKHIKAADDKEFLKKMDGQLYWSVGAQLELQRQGTEGTFSRSNGTTGLLTKAQYEAYTISPLSVWLNLHLKFKENYFVFGGLAYSHAKLESGSAGSTLESSSTFAPQFGAGYQYDNMKLQFVYRPATYDFSGTVIGTTTTVSGTFEYNYFGIMLGYIF